MDQIARQILDSLRAKPGQRATELAGNLGADRRVINRVLASRLKGQVRQDASYRWYISEALGPARSGPADGKPGNTPLARLCRYYLDCLSHDDLGGVSEFASSTYGDVNYVELAALPVLESSPGSPFDTGEGRKFLGRLRRDRNRQSILLGYPVRLTFLRGRKGWEGFKVEPLLLFAFQGDSNGAGIPTLAEGLPHVNFAVLRSLAPGGEANLLEEAIALARELGLDSGPGDQPDLDELFERLRVIRADWDWSEAVDPYELSRGAPLSELKQAGIYNRAILVAAERSPYTRGLESELGSLQSVAEGKYRGTALGAWLRGQALEPPKTDEQPLLEVLPLNTEQRQAVRQALSNPLTVITGPPGTGKSQVVSSILVNAARQGKSVLLASKNNKAVDVVELRVNALGPRPVLLRLGTSQIQAKLADYLVSLLAASVTPEDHERFREQEAVHKDLQRLSSGPDDDLRALIELRNNVDRLEQQVEDARLRLGNVVFSSWRTVDEPSANQAAKTLQLAITSADKRSQSLWTRLRWPLVQAQRFRHLGGALQSFQPIAEQLGLPLPDWQADPSTIPQWTSYGWSLAKTVSDLTSVKAYFAGLEALGSTRTFEELSQERSLLTDELSSNSEAYWQLWLRLQPARLNPEDRRLIGDYSALLQMIVNAHDEDRQIGREVFRRYYQLFPKVAKLLSCWAVTSLSARGRIPFEPSFFDLLVVDEASQCDIASALPLLYRARSAVIIGDPKQLRHISALSKPQDQQLLSKHDLLDAFPAWAYSTDSLFDLASGLCRSEDVVALRDHHRSHSDIIEFSNGRFYDGRLRVATKYDRLRIPSPSEPAVRWVDVRGRAVRPGGGSVINENEAAAVVAELERLTSQGYRGSIGVVSPFRPQANRIRDIVNERPELVNRLATAEFLVDTVHRFQGDERDVMFFSPVVSSGFPDGAARFLINNENLFNVAITRARAALIVVGNRTAAMNSKIDYLAEFAEYAAMINNGVRAAASEGPLNSGPEYPAVSNPDQVSDWERLLYRALYSRGIRPLPQYRVEHYVLDFALIDGDRRLAIEVDGERYHRNWDGELCRRDQIRNQRLLELGWDIQRFWVYQVRDELPRCLSRIEEWAAGGTQLTWSQSPSSCAVPRRPRPKARF